VANFREHLLAGQGAEEGPRLGQTTGTALRISTWDGVHARVVDGALRVSSDRERPLAIHFVGSARVIRKRVGNRELLVENGP
jgi:hypothetical protein